MTDIEHSLPLTPAVFHILLALAKGDKHGYEVMKAVHRDSNGKVNIGSDTLPGSLERMLADGLVEEDREHAGDDDTRRKYYTLTARLAAPQAPCYAGTGSNKHMRALLFIHMHSHAEVICR